MIRPRQRLLPLLSLLLLASALRAQQSRRADWALPDAVLRADVLIRERPAEPDLGVYLPLPDGGLLPKFPLVDVVDAAGKPLESHILWHNPDDALGLVFRPPAGTDEVAVYIRAASALPPRPPATTLKPSLFVFTRNDASPSIEKARKMAAEWPPAAGAFAGKTERIGLRGNPYGDDDNFCSWFTGWFKLDQREALYLATVSDEGSEFHLDGALYAAWPGLHTRAAGNQGQFGKSATLEPGWHRIDYYHFEVAGDQEMSLVWKREKDGKKLPYLMDGKAWGRTGQAELLRLTAADNRVVGWVSGNLQADGYLWVGNNPVHLHTLSCNGVRPAADIKIAWDFGQGRIVAETASCRWLFPDSAAAPATASLTVSSPAGMSRQSFRVASGNTPPPFSLSRPDDRLRLRTTLYAMAQATPKDPCAAWTGDLWATLVETLEPYKGGPLLIELFNRGWPTLQTLPREQRHLLEDRFAETLRIAQDTAKQLDWIDRLQKNERDRARQFRWREERIACHLYDQGDLEAARRAARALREASSSPEEIQRAVLRLGDVERLAGDRDQAARFYADAQERYRSRNRLGADAGAWKRYAVNDAAQSATIRAYLAQDAVSEAFAALDQWENDAPLSKLGGDFPLTEARVYAQVGDPRRVAAILAAYHSADLMTSQLPDAMALHLEALMQLKRFPEARALAQATLKRFPGLPAAALAERILAQTRN